MPNVAGGWPRLAATNGVAAGMSRPPLAPSCTTRQRWCKRNRGVFANAEPPGSSEQFCPGQLLGRARTLHARTGRTPCVCEMR